MGVIDLPKIYTIPAGLAFADTLATGLWDEYRDNLLGLADVHIYMPNRRSCRALADAFLVASDGRATLLPRITPLGDIDADDLADTDPFVLDADPALLPPMDPVARRLDLMRLVMARGDMDTPVHAWNLAGDLAALIDMAHNENVDLNKINTLVTGDLARHWQKTCDFLSIITDAWPKHTAEKNMCDGAAHRNILIRKKADALRDTRPKMRIIAAGSTGSIASVRALLGVIARLPNGSVILPGFDGAAAAPMWDAIDPTHPFYHIKLLIDSLDIAPEHVKPWKNITPSHSRAGLLAAAFQPPAIFDLTHTAVQPSDFNGLDFICADTRLHEAHVIALALREILNEKNKTAMVVTPDRILAQYIADAMRRWDVMINDSGGITLDQTRIGGFLRLLADYADTAMPMTATLSLMSHPLFMPDAENKDKSEALNLISSRFRDGLLPPGGLGTYAHECQFLTELLNKTEPLCVIHDDTLASWAKNLVSASESLSTPDMLWAGDEGTHAADMLRNIIGLDEARHIRVTRSDFARILQAMLAGITVRPRYGLHPRIRILSPIESRLQMADVVILAGLNEGTWPSPPAHNPWMSRPMMRDMGFDSPDRRIGQSALDFYNGFAAPRVLLTWAKSRDDTPVLPARWLEQVFAIADKTIPKKINPDAHYLAHWARQWDRPSSLEYVAPPSYAPPHKVTAVSVTEVGLWTRDPYAFYAKKMLGVTPPNPLDRAPDARDWGNAVHKILEEWHKTGQFEQAARDVLAEYALGPAQRAEWQRKLDIIARDIDQHRGQDDAEISMSTDIKGPKRGHTMRLYGRADRIDNTPKGLVIIDYKTGSPPSQKNVASHREPQLPLLGLLAQHKNKNATVVALRYIQLKGRDTNAIAMTDLKDPDNLILQTAAHVGQLVDRYAAGAPFQANSLSVYERDDFDHIKRTDEWAETHAGDDDTEQDAA